MPNIRFSMSKFNLFSSKNTAYKRPISKCYFAFLFSVSVLQFSFFFSLGLILSIKCLVSEILFGISYLNCVFRILFFCNLHFNCLSNAKQSMVVWQCPISGSQRQYSTLSFSQRKTLQTSHFKILFFFISVFDFLLNRKNRIIKLKSN